MIRNELRVPLEARRPRASGEGEWGLLGVAREPYPNTLRVEKATYWTAQRIRREKEGF
jgi:hypothetical protein